MKQKGRHNGVGSIAIFAFVLTYWTKKKLKFSDFKEFVEEFYHSKLDALHWTLRYLSDWTGVPYYSM